MREAAMLLLLRRLPMDDVTFCAFEKIRKPTIAENSQRTHGQVCMDRVCTRENQQQIEKLVLICASRTRENLWDDGSYTEVFLELLFR
jgi:hypothetical protein